jgi:tetratricopeptide (TPR) repeat protein
MMAPADPPGSARRKSPRRPASAPAPRPGSRASEGSVAARGWRRPGLWILAFALLVRIGVLLDAQDAPFWSVPMVDEIQYLHLAESIANGQAPPHGAYYVAPGYGYLLAAVLHAGGQVPTVKILQLVVGALTSWLLFVLGRRMFGVGAGLVAGGLWALYPGALLHEILLLKPAWTVLFAVGGLVLLARPSSRPWHWARGGLALGCASLLRAEMAGVGLALVAMGLVARWRAWPWAPPRWGAPLAALGIAAIVAVPTVENLRHGGGPVVIAYGGGPNFYIGNHAGADGSYLPLRPDRSDARFEEQDAVELAQSAEGRPLRPAEVSRYWWGRGLSWWGEDPGGALALTLKKAALVWSWWEGADVLSRRIAARWVILLRDGVLRAGVLLPLALVGLWVHRRRRELWPVWTFLAASQLALTPFFLFERFRLPLTAVATVPAAGALYAAAAAWRRRKPSRVLLGAVATVALAVLLTVPKVARNEVVLRVNVGSLLLQQQRYEEALREFMTVRREVPSARRVEINIATTLYEMGRDPQALAAVRSALEFLYAEARATGRPPVEELLSCHVLAGDIQRRLGRLDRARQEYEAALGLSPRNPDIQRRLATVRAGASP